MNRTVIRIRTSMVSGYGDPLVLNTKGLHFEVLPSLTLKDVLTLSAHFALLHMPDNKRKSNTSTVSNVAKKARSVCVGLIVIKFDA